MASIKPTTATMAARMRNSGRAGFCLLFMFTVIHCEGKVDAIQFDTSQRGSHRNKATNM